jgi:uncharacterized protein YggE
MNFLKSRLVLLAFLSLPLFFLFGFLIVIGMALGNKFIGNPTWSQSVNLLTTEQSNLFSAQGEAKLAVIPDQAVINLGVSSTKTTVKAAQDEVNQIINTLQDSLFQLNIEKKNVKTQNYSLYPSYDYTTGTQRITGYSVNSTLEVTVTDFSLLNQIIDLATNGGINQISNINFTLSDTKTAELKTQARQIAIEQAKNNAQDLAKLTGINLGQIINVTENQSGGYAPTPMPVNYKLLSSVEPASDTSVQAGETTFNYFVTLSYQIL